MATQNPKISVYIPPDVEERLREVIKDWDTKDKNGKPVINKSKIIVDILRDYLGIESSDTGLNTITDRLAELENNFKVLEETLKILTINFKDKPEAHSEVKESPSLPLLELIDFPITSVASKENLNFKTATTQELLQLLEEIEPEKDWNYEKLRRIRKSKIKKLPLKIGDYEIDWLSKGTTEQSSQHLWRVVYLGSSQPLPSYRTMK